MENEDLVEARGAARAAELRARRQSVLADTGRAALQGATVAELIDTATAELRQLLDCDAVVVLELGDEAKTLRVRTGAAEQEISGDAPFEFRTVWSDGPTLWSHDSEQPGPGVALPFEARSALATVIRAPVHHFGVLAAYRKRPGEFADDDVLYVRSIANVLGAAAAREATERDLRTRDLENRLAFTAGRMGAWQWDPKTDRVVWSAELEQLFGFRAGSFGGSFDAYVTALHPEDRERVATTIEEARVNARGFTVEHRIVRPSDGSVRWIEGRATAIRDAGGDIERWVGVAIDITERITRDAALREREIQTRFAFEAGQMGSWTWSETFQRGSFSPELEALLGRPVGSYDGTWEGFIAPVVSDDHELLRAAVVDAADREDAFTVRYRIVRDDGQLRWVESRGRRASAGEWVGVTIDVTDPMRVEEERRRNAALVRATYDTAPVGLAFFDQHLTIQFVNEHLAELTGVPADDHVGRRISDTAPGIGPLLETELGAVLRRRRARLQLEIVSEVADETGGPRSFEASFYPVVDDDDELIGLGLVVVDTSVRRANQQALVEAHDRLGATVARLDGLLEHGPFGFAFLDRDGRIIGLNQRYSELTDAPREVHVGRLIAEVAPEVGDAIRDAIKRVVSDRRPAADVELTTAGVGERFWLLSHYPIRDADGEVAGVGSLAVDITEQRRRERAERLRARASELVSLPVDEGSDLSVVAAVAVPEFADVCALFLPAGHGLTRRVAIVHADGGDLQRDLSALEARWPIDIGRFHAALDGAETLLVDDVDDVLRRSFGSDDPDAIDLAERVGVQSVLLARVAVGARDLGVVAFGYTKSSGRRYHDDDRALARDLADRFAQLLERSYLSREAEHAASRLDLLAAISELLTVDLDSQARLDAIVEVVIPSFAESCAVYIPVGDDAIEMVAFASASPHARSEWLALGSPIRHPLDSMAPPSQVMRTGEPILIRDLDHGPDVAADLGETSARLRVATNVDSLIVVPLPGLDTPIGVIAFGLSGRGRRYEPSDSQLAGEIARRVSPAVENAWRFEREIATTEQLQRILLPERLDHVDGAEIAARYLPSAVDVRVGGDWYDTVGLPDGRLLVTIGDVAGHGARAATWMGKLRSVVQFCLFDGLSPAETLEHVNRYCLLLPGSDMTTAMIGIYDPATRRLQFASAGHPPALVRHADATVREIWDGRGPPLGALDHPQFEAAEIVLETNEVLVLYTDGLVERRGESIDVGLHRLAAAVATERPTMEMLVESIIGELFSDVEPADDVAVLVLRPRRSDLDLRVLLRSSLELSRLRSETRSWLGRYGVDDEGRVGEILVAVNELAANALEHAYGPSEGTVEVTAVAHNGIGVFEVTDRGRWRQPALGSTHRGRGLRIVTDLTDEFSLDRSLSGTVARFQVGLGGA